MELRVWKRYLINNYLYVEYYEIVSIGVRGSKSR